MLRAERRLASLREPNRIIMLVDSLLELMSLRVNLLHHKIILVDLDLTFITGPIC